MAGGLHVNSRHWRMFGWVTQQCFHLPADIGVRTLVVNET